MTVQSPRTERVLAELKQLRTTYCPTYESRAEYDTLVGEYVRRLSAPPAHDAPGDPTPARTKTP